MLVLIYQTMQHHIPKGKNVQHRSIIKGETGNIHFMATQKSPSLNYFSLPAQRNTITIYLFKIKFQLSQLLMKICIKSSKYNIWINTKHLYLWRKKKRMSHNWNVTCKYFEIFGPGPLAPELMCIKLHFPPDSILCMCLIFPLSTLFTATGMAFSEQRIHRGSSKHFCDTCWIRTM
jgi:hypothetical protein